MKKYLFAFIFIIILSLLHAEEYVIYLGNGYNADKTSKELTKINFAIKYDDSENTYYFFTNDAHNTSWIFISKEQLDIIRKNLKKYIEWEKLAVQNKSIIEKQLPDSSITTYVFWKFNDNWYSADSLVLRFVFLSQTSSRHHLCISSSKVEPNSNESIDFRLNTIYLKKDQVKSFLKGISEKAVDKVQEENKMKKKNEEIFQ